jgi:lysozyme
LNPAQLAAWYLGAAIRVHKRVGYWPTIYGSPSFLQEFATYHPEVFGLCPLWLANYGVAKPTIPAPWTHFAAWQHTDKFKDPAAGSVDDSWVPDLKALLIPGVTVVKRILA